MSSIGRSKEERAEKKTELFRIHLENTLTMDSLTGWLKKIVEVPENKRPSNVLKFFVENRDLWSGNVVSRAMKKAIEDVHSKLTEVQESNRKYKRHIAHLETLLLNRRVAALDVSAKNLKKKLNNSQTSPAAPDPLKQLSPPKNDALPNHGHFSVGGAAPVQLAFHPGGGVPHSVPTTSRGGDMMHETAIASQFNGLTDGISESLARRSLVG